ncbi:TCR gamma alternate reading frame protein [Sarcophilus harrisii]|nr:TCR gamma alternate reading frame protein [Sarcophilus harrisii]
MSEDPSDDSLRMFGTKGGQKFTTGPARMSLCQVLAVATLWAFGHSAIELKQPQVSITSQVGTAARVTCHVAGMRNFAVGHAAIELKQPQVSITRRPGTAARVTCQVAGSENFEDMLMYWYQQKPNQPLQYLISVQSTIPQVVFAAGCPTVGNVKIFGEGTKLIVTKSVIPKKPPKSIIFLPTFEEVKQKKSGTYICLLEDFFPNVIKSYWKENKYSQPLDAQFGPITGNGSSYSQVSWLTVPEDSLSKNFTYFYQHENTGIEPQEIPIASVWKDFKNSSSETCKDKDWTKGLQELHFANISAFYTYTILLVKSTIYFTIVLFFLYQKKVVKMLGSQRSK